MLKLRNICKYYKEGKDRRVILDDINIDFKKRELVFILGRSGSGKSTLLNIIGGNLKSDSGEIYLDDILVSKFGEKELNNYRGSIVGNVFQDYNLIEYMNVWDNIMLGYNGNFDKVKINTLLKQLDIYDKKRMLVKCLSGGEKQRVAIARAMVNDPKIILCDEPTGALDSVNSIQVMEILKRISKNKLVIVVSHDNYLANKYGDRIINIKDGKCEYREQIDNSVIGEIKKSKIKNGTIRRMAIKNLWLKKWRTLFTSISISLGLISMIIVLCLASGFKKEIDLLEEEVVSIFPISINNLEYEIMDNDVDKGLDKIIIKDREEFVHTNKISREYMDYLLGIDEIRYMTYKYDMSVPIISDRYEYVGYEYFSVYVSDNYEILYGRDIKDWNEILLKVDSNNNVLDEVLNSFLIYDDIDYSDIIGRKVRIVLNDLYYEKSGEYYLVNDDNKYLYDNSSIELTIVGVVREKDIIDDDSGFLYDSDVINRVLDGNRNSMIVKEQLERSDNVFGINIDKDSMLSYLGYNTLPSSINIYVDNLLDKDVLLDKLDKYNEGEDKLIYVDTMASAIEIVNNFVSIISVVLVFFSMIAIVISSLMVGILTNIRVLERKKEVGIFRSLGASKRMIVRLFDMENIFIGVISSVISILVVVLLRGIINDILYSLLEIDGMFRIDFRIVLVVMLVNILIVKLSGNIPARRASRMEIVSCIYDR